MNQYVYALLGFVLGLSIGLSDSRLMYFAGAAWVVLTVVMISVNWRKESRG